MNPFYTTYTYIPFDQIKEADYEPAMLKGIEEEDQEISFTATNTRKTGAISISKEVISDVGEDKDRATYRVTIQLNESVTGTFNGTKSKGETPEETSVTFEDGFSDEIEIADGETITITGLPAGASYQVVEAVPDYFEEPVYVNETGSISGTEPAEVTITNERKTGNLIL